MRTLAEGKGAALGRRISLQTEAGLMFTTDGRFSPTAPNARVHFGLIAALTQATFSCFNPDD